ncbi:MAG TPA: enoyl-CoA hydratase/isomerase family protein [Actinomycetota bacterium]|nr:enoyl-CoA hydratase/isomerase family protein [Actinomycetota bacterium]
MALLELSFEGPVARVTLDRPDARNALSREMCDAIVDAFVQIDADPDVRLTVLGGNGPVFCSGADFAAVSGPSGLEFLPAFERMLEAVARHRLPTLAVIHGAALGGGFQLACVCDFRIAADDAQIGIPSSRLGILVNFENIQRLVLLGGIARAKEILMAGRTFSGGEAADAGLVTMGVPADGMPAVVQAFTDRVIALAPLSVQGSKRAIQTVIDHLASVRDASPEAVAEIDRLVALAYSSADLAEGLAAMSERRPPDFTAS